MAKRDLTLKVYSDGRGRWRWRAKAGNGEQLARSPRGYREQDDVMADIHCLFEEDHEPEIYRDGRKEYRWRVRKGDGTIIAIGSEGYKRRIDCSEAADLLLSANPIGDY